MRSGEVVSRRFHSPKVDCSIQSSATSLDASKKARYLLELLKNGPISEFHLDSKVFGYRTDFSDRLKNSIRNARAKMISRLRRIGFDIRYDKGARLYFMPEAN